ncbi:MAG: diaminopimelate epimerase [Gammaproteobacteria bacterium]|nr:diaminopimelate epimerase [Gammaproteobacteria bacterium]
MRLDFWKMQGLGNDFLVFDAPAGFLGRPMDAALLRRLADRHTGIGFDQALMLEPPRDPATSVYYRIFNADGGEVEQCGNGARCVAALQYARNPAIGRALALGSPGGTVRARIAEDGRVSVEIGIPNFDPRSLPMDGSGETPLVPIRIGEREVRLGVVSVGNPHAVVYVEDIDAAPVATLGPAIEGHPAFPRRVNVGFLQIHDRAHVSLRVFERGVGETLACGTGACAAVAVGRRHGRLDAEVDVDLRGGRAHVRWPGDGESAWLTGPATVVFTGSIEI